MVSIIIPVLNEEDFISGILNYLQSYSEDVPYEIIVVDGGSTDRTAELAVAGGAKLISSARGRARQMNYGAEMARGDILYFLHVDTFPPAGFLKTIQQAVDDGHRAGCFQMKFDTDSKFLSFFAWFTKLNHSLCRGGDQSLFISRELFEESGGFDEKFMVYEDTEFIRRLYKMDHFKILPQKVTTSARRYRQKGTIRLQYHFGVIHFKRMMGAGPRHLQDYYQRHIAS